MTAMYKIFYAMLFVGGMGGIFFSFWSLLFVEVQTSFLLFVGLSAIVGVFIGLANYVFIKAILRVFVKKFHTLERVLVGTEPGELPNVFLSNEMDEIEAAIVRITDKYNKLSTTLGNGITNKTHI